MSTARSPRGRDRNLDILRGLAALGVVLWHATGNVAGGSGSVSAGWRLALHASASVFLFFALSGALIGGPWLIALLHGTSLPDWRGYAVRRVARIVPVYWLTLIAALIILHPPGATAPSVVLHALLLQNLVPGQATALYVVLWTLGIEFQAYVTIPLVALLVRRLSRSRVSPRALLAGCAAAWLMSAPVLLSAGPAGIYGPGAASFLAATLIGQMGAFAAGFAVVVMNDTDWRLDITPGYFVAAGCLLWVFASVITPGSGPTPSPLWALAAFCLVLGASRARPWPLIPLAWCGAVSYALYLVHSLVGAFLPPISGVGMGPLALAFVMLAVPSLVVATLVYLAVEWPSQRAGHWLARRISERPPGAPVASVVGRATEAVPRS